MAFRPLLRRRAVIPATAAALAASTIFFPLTTLHAEAPPSVLPPKRKPIYSDPPPRPEPQPPPLPPPDATYTARLATQIRRARLTLHTQTTSLETRLNTLLTSLLSLETSVTSTLASLAPPPDSHEKLIPGAIYVLVAAMAGSIAARNRNVLLRASVPAAVGSRPGGWAAGDDAECGGFGVGV
ncbi:MAG: hypothetical protein FRX48_02793 [Lasallia pustulata]|uniref:MICOS complex subunit n=1 Tax=Lasallia pustulata TaxID=136370 RepID=A0A5M8PTV4_9LECA|nr:MAG: hypothetical protein FRX48_02793 [Lasallia pustulata]